GPAGVEVQPRHRRPVRHRLARPVAPDHWPLLIRVVPYRRRVRGAVPESSEGPRNAPPRIPTWPRCVARPLRRLRGRSTRPTGPPAGRGAKPAPRPRTPPPPPAPVRTNATADSPGKTAGRRAPSPPRPAE